MLSLQVLIKVILIKIKLTYKCQILKILLFLIILLKIYQSQKNISIKKFKIACYVICIAKLYADPTLPRSHVQIVMDDTAALFSNIISFLKPAISFICNKTESIENVSNIFDLLDTVFKLFTDLNSEYKRIKTLQATVYFIKPQHILLEML